LAVKYKLRLSGSGKDSERTNTYSHFYGATEPSALEPTDFGGFTITLRHTTLGRNPLDDRSVRIRDLYLTIHNTHNRQTAMPLTGFEPVIPRGERPSDPRFRPRGH
jgi:hypothetical protein